MESFDARACYRGKNKGKGKRPLNAKTQVVARGNQDLDLKSLTRQATTPGTALEMLILVIFVAGANKKAFRSKGEWFLWMGDAAAFLQGTQDTCERAGKLFLKAPILPWLRPEITGNVSVPLFTHGQQKSRDACWVLTVLIGCSSSIILIPTSPSLRRVDSVCGRYPAHPQRAFLISKVHRRLQAGREPTKRCCLTSPTHSRARNRSETEVTLSIAENDFTQGPDMLRVSCRGRKDDVLSSSDF